ncbi:hypothetical protein CS542_08090 [Pedobacter sp. IW39]|nr:hypothetical protein CS542_08090 [Pedobacter sp. IW39]
MALRPADLPHQSIYEAAWHKYHEKITDKLTFSARLNSFNCSTCCCSSASVQCRLLLFSLPEHIYHKAGLRLAHQTDFLQ